MQPIVNHIRLCAIVVFVIAFSSCLEYEHSYFEEINLELKINVDDYYRLTFGVPGELSDTLDFLIFSHSSSPIIYLVEPDRVYLDGRYCELLSAKMHNYKLRLVFGGVNVHELLNPEHSIENILNPPDSLMEERPYAFRSPQPQHGISLRKPYYGISYYGRLGITTHDGRSLHKKVLNESVFEPIYF